MNESDLQRVYNYLIYPRGSKIFSAKGFVYIDDGFQGGTHWCCFKRKDKMSFYFDSFGFNSDKFLPNQKPQRILNPNYKTEDKNSKLCSSYCLYFFCLIERMKYNDAILKMYFWFNK